MPVWQEPLGLGSQQQRAGRRVGVRDRPQEEQHQEHIGDVQGQVCGAAGQSAELAQKQPQHAAHVRSGEALAAQPRAEPRGAGLVHEAILDAQLSSEKELDIVAGTRSLPFGQGDQ